MGFWEQISISPYSFCWLGYWRKQGVRDDLSNCCQRSVFVDWLPVEYGCDSLSSGGVSSLHLTLGPLLELCLGSHLWTLYDAQVPDALLDDWLWVTICPTFITLMKMKVLVALSCLTFCNFMDCSPPGFSVHGILQARIQKWVAIPFSRGSSWPRDRTNVFCT